MYDYSERCRSRPDVRGHVVMMLGLLVAWGLFNVGVAAGALFVSELHARQARRRADSLTATYLTQGYDEISVYLVSQRSER